MLNIFFHFGVLPREVTFKTIRYETLILHNPTPWDQKEGPYIVTLPYLSHSPISITDMLCGVLLSNTNKENMDTSKCLHGNNGEYN